jgi:hypothetical protein
MFFPRFTLRTILVVTTLAAVFFLLVGTGYRGQQWAWGAAIGFCSLGVVAIVHAACFGVVWCVAQLALQRSRSSRRRRRDSARVEATT